MSIVRLATLVCAAIFGLTATAIAADPPINPELLSSRWSAQWIRPDGATSKGFGVYHFRKHLALDMKPERFVVHVSGDNRFELFVNGTRVLMGPARGDLDH